MKKKLLVLLLSLFGVFLITASSGSCFNDSGTTGTNGNAETYCDHGNRVYDDTSGHGLAVVAHDPTCPQPTPSSGR